jgi:cytochrome b561
MQDPRPSATASSYPPLWRALHWGIAAAVAILIPVGAWMTARGEAGLWDGLTNTLYAWHKAIGFLVPLAIVLRLALRLRLGVPAYPAELSPLRRRLAGGLGRVFYVLLFAVPLAGWAGVTAYPALVTVGGFNLPAMPLVPQDSDLAGRFFAVHGTLALLLGALALGHVAIALHHLLVKRDRVFERMWPRGGDASGG